MLDSTGEADANSKDFGLPQIRSQRIDLLSSL